MVVKNYGPELLDYLKFISDIRGPLSDKRKSIINKAFDIASRKAIG